MEESLRSNSHKLSKRHALCLTVTLVSQKLWGDVENWNNTCLRPLKLNQLSALICFSIFCRPVFLLLGVRVESDFFFFVCQHWHQYQWPWETVSWHSLLLRLSETERLRERGVICTTVGPQCCEHVWVFEGRKNKLWQDRWPIIGFFFSDTW